MDRWNSIVCRGSFITPECWHTPPVMTHLIRALMNKRVKLCEIDTAMQKLALFAHAWHSNPSPRHGFVSTIPCLHPQAVEAKSREKWVRFPKTMTRGGSARCLQSYQSLNLLRQKSRVSTQQTHILISCLFPSTDWNACAALRRPEATVLGFGTRNKDMEQKQKLCFGNKPYFCLYWRQLWVFISYSAHNDPKICTIHSQV